MSSYPVALVDRGPNAAAGVIDADDPDLDDLRFAILARIRPALADLDRVDCRLDRDGSNVIVHLTGPSVSAMRRNALAVRVLDAVRSIGRTYGHVDLVDEATANESPGT